MQVVKCPRCDINFMRDGEDCCKVCKRELKGLAEKVQELEMCAECGENPALVGEDICSDCMKERKRLLEIEPKSIGKRKAPVDDSDDEDDLPLDEIEVPLPDEDLEDDGLEELDIDLDEDADADIGELDEEDLVELEEEDEFDREEILDDYSDERKHAEILDWEMRDRNSRAR